MDKFQNYVDRILNPNSGITGVELLSLTDRLSEFAKSNNLGVGSVFKEFINMLKVSSSNATNSPNNALDFRKWLGINAGVYMEACKTESKVHNDSALSKIVMDEFFLKIKTIRDEAHKQYKNLNE